MLSETAWFFIYKQKEKGNRHRTLLPFAYSAILNMAVIVCRYLSAVWF